MTVTKTSLNSVAPTTKVLALEDAVWEIMRFGGYDKGQSVAKLLICIRDDFSKGFVLHTDFNKYQRTGGLMKGRVRVSNAKCAICGCGKTHYFHSGKTTMLVVCDHPNQQHDFLSVAQAKRDQADNRHLPIGPAACRE